MALAKKYISLNGELVGEINKVEGTRTDYLTDALGSVVGTFAQEESAPNHITVLNTYRYQPYGGVLAKTGSSPDPRYLWTGNSGSRYSAHRFAEQYNWHRHYGQFQGQWTSRDILWPEESAFGYVSGNPVVLTDYCGLSSLRLTYYAFIHKKRGVWNPYPVYHDPAIDPFNSCYFKGDQRDFGGHPSSRVWSDLSIETTLLGRYPFQDQSNASNVGVTTRRCKPRFQTGSPTWTYETRSAKFARKAGHPKDMGDCETMFYGEVAAYEGFKSILASALDASIFFAYNYFVTAIKLCVNGQTKYFIQARLESFHTKFPDFESYGELGRNKKTFFKYLSPYSLPNAGTLGGYNTVNQAGTSLVWEVSAGDMPAWCR